MKKRVISILILTVLSLGLLASCTSNEPAGEWTADPFTALEAVCAALPVKDLPEDGNLYDSKVTDEDADYYLDDYTRMESFKNASGEADFSCVESVAIYVPAADKATNIGILKAKSEADVAAVEQLVNQKIANVQTKFKSYIPDQDKIAQKTLTKTNGLYVYYVIAQDVNKVSDLIKAELAK